MSETTNRADFLSARGSAQGDLHTQARETRERHFGNRVFVRGVIEVSNFCRQNCAYCGMRRDNRTLKRYRLSVEALADYVLKHLPRSVTDLNIQSGEDPVAVRQTVIPLLRILRKETQLGLSVCVGTLTESMYAALRESGAEYYVMKIETGNPQHYLALGSPGTLDQRLKAIHHLADTGWNVSSGMIAGLPGQTAADILQTLSLLESLPLKGCSVSPFISGEGTPLSSAVTADPELALNILALMRQAKPGWIIPAVSAMTHRDENGYVRALRAGANLATVNFTPTSVRDDYVLYRPGRQIMTERKILAAIEAAGCAPSHISIATYLRGEN